MKGGKEGRKRRTAGGGPAAALPRGKAKKGAAKRPASTAPKKGSRRKSYGAIPSSPDDA